jgi:GT2 family glycosyltransferase
MMQYKNDAKIGIGVVTYERSRLFRECISSIPDADVLVVVNDGTPYPATQYPSRIAQVIQHRRNIGVGRSKNQALRYLLQSGCTHLFLCEDDIRIINPHVCDEYIHASEHSGILHFNFGYHGPRNKMASGDPQPRMSIEYGNQVTLSFNRFLVGAFSYYHRKTLEVCGLMDPLFRNFMEHVDHTNRIIRKGFHPPFLWFADLKESYRQIEDLDPHLEQSSMKNQKWHAGYRLALQKAYFLLKNRHLPWNMPDTDEKTVRKILDTMRTTYGK